jgi:hypothetical protein
MDAAPPRDSTGSIDPSHGKILSRRSMDFHAGSAARA